MVLKFVLPRLYPILDTGALQSSGCGIVDAARFLLQGGMRILQIRHKDHWSRALFAEAAEVARLCREQNAMLVVNDRADMAILLDAGLHVGQDDLPPSEARRLIGPEKLLGFSTHNLAQLREAGKEPVDYIAVGPVFTTVSKKNPDPVIGVEGVREWRGEVSHPLVAIGGINRLNAPGVLAAGADTLAVIGDILPQSCEASAWQERLESWKKAVPV